jgi:hypothetical protein
MRKESPELRFPKYYVCRLDTKCWEWIGSFDGQPRGGPNPRGRYGRFVFTGRANIAAHRASYLIHKGPIADGLQVCHSCDNPSCVNPEHLWLGDAQANMDDQIAKGRSAHQNGYVPKPVPGSISHKSPTTGRRVVDTTCCICGNGCEQEYTGWILKKKACCSPACKSKRLSEAMRAARARKSWNKSGLICPSESH